MNDSYHEVAAQIERMRELGVEPGNEILEALREIRDPYYRIGFVGRFQTGKTHIINKIFLNDENLLAEGTGLCKTAVTVEIRHGGEKQFSYGNGDQIEVITNPDHDKIAKTTAATEDDERVRLFNDIDNAVLSYPGELLCGVSIYDTPGIDDPNDELLRETTYKLLPELDMTVMVVAPKALSRAELRFLQKKIFSCGIGRFMMLVSCKPMDQCEPEDEEVLRTQIRNQLNSIGRTDIPVFFYREDADGHPLAGDNSVSDAIISCARDFTLGNRCCKLRKAMAAQLREEITRLTVASGVYGKNQSELIGMKSEAIRALNELQQSINDLQNEFSTRLAQHGTICVHGFEADIRGARDKFISKLNDADGLGEAQDLLNNADSDLQQDLEDIIVARMHGFYGAARRLADELAGDLRKRWQENICPIMFREVDGGRVQNWNSALITIGDYVLSGWLLPGGFFLSLGLRWILGKIPVVKSILPTNLAKDHMIGVAAESLDAQMTGLVEEFAEHIAGEEKKICEFLATANQKEIERQQDLLNAISDRENKNDADFDIVAVREKISELGNLLEQLA